MAINLYNKEPENIKKLDKLKLFKKELKSLILSNSFYSVDQFLQFWVELVCKVGLSVSLD